MSRLIARGADLNALTEGDEWTPLDVAEINEDAAIIEYLEFHVANRNDIDDVNDDDNSSVDI